MGSSTSTQTCLNPDLYNTSTSSPACLHPEVDNTSKSTEACLHPEVDNTSTSSEACLHPEVDNTSTSFEACSHPEVGNTSTSFEACSHPEVDNTSTSFEACLHPEVDNTSTSSEACSHPEVDNTSTSSHACLSSYLRSLSNEDILSLECTLQEVSIAGLTLSNMSEKLIGPIFHFFKETSRFEHHILEAAEYIAQILKNKYNTSTGLLVACVISVGYRTGRDPMEIAKALIYGKNLKGTYFVMCLSNLIQTIFKLFN